MRGQADHLAGPDQARVEQRRADQAVVQQAGAGSRSVLLQRLEKLAPWHPSSVRAADRQSLAAQPDPDGRAAEADADARLATADADARPATDADARPPGPDSHEGSFWDNLSHFEALWQAHLNRWPDKPAQADRPRPDDPPGSWRGDGNRYLSPQDNAEADKIISLLRGPEEAITEQLIQIQNDNPHGGYLAGMKHRIKGEDRLKEKIVDEMESEIGTGLGDAASRISDALRYTFCFDIDQCVNGCDGVRQRLESDGYRMTYSKNHWLNDPEYKGINSRWETPDGARFELQFHTSESFHAKENLTHRSYDRLRSRETSRPERRNLHTYQRIICDALPVPEGLAEFLDTP